MSSSVPFLAKAEGIGWDEWIKSLVRVSFMAPIFMFLLYLTFKLINANLFASLSDRTFEQQGTLEAIILMTLPAFVVLIILHKATEKAQKWSGELGAMLTKGVAVAGTVAGGVALGGGAAVLQASLGRAGSMLTKSQTLKQMETTQGGGWRNALTRFTGARLRDVGGAAASGSFDARKGAVGAVLGGIEKVTGLRVGASSKLLVKDGGYEADRKRAVEKRQKRAKDLEVTEDEQVKQDLNEVEDSHQELLVRDGNAHEIEQIDNRIKVLSVRASDAARDERLASSRGPGGEVGGATNPLTGRTYAEDARLAKEALKDEQGERLAIKNASMFLRSDGRLVDHREATNNQN